MIQVLKETTTDYHLFVGRIAHEVGKAMGEGYHVEISKVSKNNSVELDSLVVFKGDINIAPHIYLMPYYESYLSGTRLEELVERLCSMYRHCSIPMLGDNLFHDFELIKSYVVYRLVNYEKNKEILETVPHLRLLDLAITFHYMVRDDGETIGTIRITNEHISYWNVNKEQLLKLANSNTIRLLPSRIRSMEEVLREILDEFDGDELDLSEPCDERVDNEFEIKRSNNEHQMYVLSNQKGIHGASCLLYPNGVKKLANYLNSDLYILPSSIHEVILVPWASNLSVEMLNSMVQDINQTQVPEEEILSNHIYYYSREKNKITM